MAVHSYSLSDRLSQSPHRPDSVGVVVHHLRARRQADHRRYDLAGLDGIRKTERDRAAGSTVTFANVGTAALGCPGERSSKTLAREPNTLFKNWARGDGI